MSHRETLGLQPRVLALWSTASVLFFVALFWSAHLGIRLAEERVPPESVAPKAQFQIGVDLEFEGKLAFAKTQHALREYIFREETTVGAGIGGRGESDVFEHDGAVTLHTVSSDLDLLQVEIVNGPRVGERFWIDEAQLKPGKLP